MGDTNIEWTDKTWNVMRGCARVSPGCLHCYAERQAHRFSGPGAPYEGLVQIANGHPQWTGKTRISEKILLEPLSWRKPQRVFVNSMSDLFYEGFSDEEIDRVFAVMALCPQHTFQVLTKRAERMREYFEKAATLWGGVTDFGEAEMYARYESIWLRMEEAGVSIGDRIAGGEWPLKNVWLGVSAEDQQRADERIPHLRRTPAAIRFVSYEPALEAVDFTPYLKGLDWIIVGGESGPGARSFDLARARNTIRQCRDAQVACFVKQLGSTVIADPFTDFPNSINLRGWVNSCNSRERGPILYDRKGGDMSEWPEDVRVREYPGRGYQAGLGNR
jgi:protein gp37